MCLQNVRAVEMPAAAAADVPPAVGAAHADAAAFKHAVRMHVEPTSIADREDAGRQMYRLVAALYPICRSITGPGVRATLAQLQQHVPLEVHEVPSGTQVFDWHVPKEWQIRDAYIKGPDGTRIVDYRQSNLHVVNYSVPVRATMSWRELKRHLFTLPEHPDWIPYRTSYYQENWGFCLSHRQFSQMVDQDYEVCIDAVLEDGSLSYGELYLPGESRDEVLVSCHICHPSLCNDNLSGAAVATFLAKHVAGLTRRYCYRFLFIPGTIGAITWLSLNEARTADIKHGLVLATLGDPGKSTYKKSRRGNAEIDRAAAHVLQHSGQDYALLDFEPCGNDERQFCSPGFNLPVGCLMRTPHGCFPEYHTSADNLDLVQPQYLADSWAKCAAIVYVLEHNRTYVNRNPKCEPQLGRRGLYHAIGGNLEQERMQQALLWVLNLSDGDHALFDIAERSGLEFPLLERAAAALLRHGLLEQRPSRSA